MSELKIRIAMLGLTAALLPTGSFAQTTMDPSGGSIPGPNGNPASVPINSTAPIGPAANNGITPPGMNASLGAPGMTGRQMKDRQFLIKAAEGGYAEVQLGKLAAEKGGPEVKEFGQKMVDDHTAINKDMGEVADQMGVPLPKKMDKEDQAEYDKLQGLSGEAFEKEYLAYMLKDHREDLHDLHMEATNASDPNLQAEVMKAAGVIRQHMQMAVKLAQDKGVPVPPRPQRPAPPAGQ